MAVAWNHPTGLVILLIFVITLVAIAGVRLLAEVANRASGADQRPVGQTVDSG